jgi:hypothetical protein
MQMQEPSAENGAKPPIVGLRNFVEFRAYRKFNVESNLTFDGGAAEPARKP